MIDMRNNISEVITDVLGGCSYNNDAAADAILAALPDMIAPLVWELLSPDDQPFWVAKDYKIQSMPRDTWEWNGRFFTDPDAAKVEVVKDHRDAIMAAFTGETT
jgi:hypothetical protein